jgi:two-component system sensor histidine kinase RegB
MAEESEVSLQTSQVIGDATNKKNLMLLIQLRWVAVIGQIATIAFVDRILLIRLPLIEMSAVVLFLVALNMVSLLRYRQKDRLTKTELLLELLLDVAALTIQIYLSGGASNPFISLYLLQVILGAVLLDSWSTWLLMAITAIAYVVLGFVYRPITMPHAHDGSFFNLHIQGMFICFLLAGCLMVFFTSRVQRNLRTRDTNLAELRQRSVEEDHIVRMGLLASGAAHELGTPLATLSVIVNDWKKNAALTANPEVADEIGEMIGQLDRCKKIVSGILASSGEARAEGTIRTTIGKFMDDTIADWRQHHSPDSFDYVNALKTDQVVISDLAIRQILFNVLDNALEASPTWIGVVVGNRDDNLVISVNDGGAGFRSDILADLGKPYRSTKSRPGAGLGLFLVMNVVRKLGGAVSAKNGQDGGACVTLTIPLSALRYAV